MSEGKHTPGPWNVCDRWPYQPDGLHINWERLQDMWIVGVRPGSAIAAIDSGPEGSIEANARLIAAAPELLAACEAAYHALRSYQYGNTATKLAEGVADDIAVAIAKARGSKPIGE